MRLWRKIWPSRKRDRRKRLSQYVTYGLLVALFGTAAVVSARASLRQNYLNHHGVPAEATITRLVPCTHSKCRYYAHVEFTTRSQAAYQTVVAVDYPLYESGIGQSVNVLYDPENPFRAKQTERNEANWVWLWFALLPVGFIGYFKLKELSRKPPSVLR